MNRKTITAAVLAAAMLAGMTGCGGNTGSSTPETSAPGAETEAPADSADSAEIPAVTTDDADASDSSDSADSENPQIAPADAASITFDYVLNGTKIVVGEEAAPVLEKLGEAESVFEAPSCAFTGSSYYYTYGGVQVVTYPDEHDQTLNRLYEVDLNDSSAATNEGIRVGDSYDDLIAKYGTPTQETPAYASYQTEGKAVRFFLDGDSIKQIVYTIVM